MSIISVEDYTIVTENEKSHNVLETLLLEWHADIKNHENHNDLTWITFDKTLTILGKNMNFRYFRHLENATKHDNKDSSLHANSLGKDIMTLFNVSEFIVGTLETFSNYNDRDFVHNVYSITMQAQITTGWSIPIFLQLGKFENVGYLGGYHKSELTTLYNTVRLKNVFPKHKTLNGLIELFREEVQQTHATKSLLEFEDTIMVSAQVANRCKIEVTDETSIIEALDVIAVWNNFCEDSLVENSVTNDFDAMKSSASWKVSMEYNMISGEQEDILQELVNYLEPTRNLREDLFDDEDDDLSIDEYIEKESRSLAENFGSINLAAKAEKEKKMWDKEVFCFDETSEKVLTEKAAKLVEKLKDRDEIVVSTSSVATRLARTLFPLHKKRISKESQLKAWTKFISILDTRYNNCEQVFDNTSIEKPEKIDCLIDNLKTLQWCLNQRKRTFGTLDDSNGFSGEEFFDAAEDFELNEEKQDSKARRSSTDGAEHPIALNVLNKLQGADIVQIRNWLRPVLFRQSVIDLAGRWPTLLDKTELEAAIEAVVCCSRSDLRDDYLEALRLIKCAERKLRMYIGTISALISNWNKAHPEDAVLRDNVEIHKLALAIINDFNAQSGCIAIGGVPVSVDAYPLGRKVIQYSMEAENKEGADANNYFKKQYVLRWNTPSLGLNTEKLDHRLFASISDNCIIFGFSSAVDNVFL